MRLLQFMTLILGMLPLFAHGQEPACSEQVLDVVRRFDPNGLAIYNAATNKKTFEFFTSQCQLTGIIAAAESGVHETLHMVDNGLSNGSTHSFRMTTGQVYAVPFLGTINRDIVYKYLTTSEHDSYAQIYLTGQSGAQGLAMLLEELNAYTQGNIAAIKVSEGLNENGTFNDGLLHMMYYLTIYLRHVRENDPQTWSMVTANNYKNVILQLWRQAENVLNQGADSKNISMDPQYLLKVYDPKNINELTLLSNGIFSSTLKIDLSKIEVEPENISTPADTDNSRLESAPAQTVKINVNGKAMSQEEIETYLKQHPEIAEILKSQSLSK
jgi:hypothetical protein